MGLHELPIATITIVITTCIVSYRAFKDKNLMMIYQLSTEGVFIQKMYFKLLYSALVHLNWLHLICNMIAFFSFGAFLEYLCGSFALIMVYSLAVMISSGFSLYENRYNPYYISIGASGGVFGIILLSVVIKPEALLSLFFLPVGIPGWIMGMILLWTSYIGMKSKSNNKIDHSAHLSGAITGALFGFILNPTTIINNPISSISIALSIISIVVLYVYPNSTVIFHDLKSFKKKVVKILEKYMKDWRQTQVDILLDKVKIKGTVNLNFFERKALDKISRNI